MFREMILHWARVLYLLVGAMSVMPVLTKAKASFGRPWESTTLARRFESELVERRAYNELQSRMPVAR